MPGPPVHVTARSGEGGPMDESRLQRARGGGERRPAGRRTAALCAKMLIPGLAGGLALYAGSAWAQETPEAGAPPGSPPEIGLNLGLFPAPNGDLTNSRDVPGSRITSQTVAGLEPAWTMPITTKPG